MVRNKKMNKTLIVNEFLKFLETIEILRSENGCPWDKVQTPESMRGALIEEAIEASSAISEKNPCHAKEELGDLFLNTLCFIDNLLFNSLLFHFGFTIFMGEAKNSIYD